MGWKPKPSPEDSPRIENADTAYYQQMFISGVFNSEYILVVGSGVILDRKCIPDSGGDINKHIINIINKQRGTNFHTFNDIYNGTARGEEDRIYNLLTREYEYEIDEISPELRQLIETKLFRFVFTTTIDGYLELLMRKVWGEELRIVNIDDARSLQDFRSAYSASRSNQYNQPTLFYVFGKVIPGRSRQRTFLETDTDAIKYIEKWFRLGYDNDDIKKFLKSKHILDLGCKYDDWYFRFFWYIITCAEGREGNFQAYDNVAAVFNPSEYSDQKLLNYLDSLNVKIHDNVWQFMIDTYKMLTSTHEDSPFRQMVLEKRREGEIFISYNSQDVIFACETYCKLSKDKTLHVWFDNIRLNGGDEYEYEIRHAINKCKIFIAILSPAVVEVLDDQQNAQDRFFIKEWRWAAQTTAKILPVAIGGYDEKSETHKTFESFFSTKPTTCINMQHMPIDNNLSEKVGFAKLLESVYKHLDS